jgi:hypothetical protein
MTANPFNSPSDEADAIERLLKGNYAKKAGTYNVVTLSVFKADAMKRAAELRLLTFLQSNSHEQRN